MLPKKVDHGPARNRHVHCPAGTRAIAIVILESEMSWDLRSREVQKHENKICLGERTITSSGILIKRLSEKSLNEFVSKASEKWLQAMWEL